MRRLIAKEYSGLFAQEEGDEDITPRRPGEPAKTSPARSWWNTINFLAGGNPLEFEKASLLPIRSAFNWLSWKKDETRRQNLAVQAQTKHQVR